MSYTVRVLLVFFFSLSLSAASSQRILTMEFETNISQIVGQLLLATLGIDVVLDNGANAYSVTYETTGSDMKPDTASGLLIIPDQINGPIPIAVYQHGTTDGRDDVPSRLGGFYQLGAITAGKGMMTLAPDYLGMGDSRGFHPYVNAETEATAAVDFVRAVITYMSENNIDWNDQLFITGYSQGGHAAMALHQYIEEVIPDEFTVTASLPMSGPYSISGVMRDIGFGEEVYTFPAYLVYTIRGMREINPTLYESEAQIFRQEFLPDIMDFVESGLGLFNMNEAIVQRLITQFGRSVPRLIFRDSILQEIETDLSHPFNQALMENDVFDWAPEAPVLMLYCPSDDQVPFRNSIVADSVMNALGAANTTSMDVSNGQMLDHTDCAVPALNVGIPWLLGFVSGTVPVFDLIADGSITLFPNPADDYVTLASEEEVERIEVYSLSGQKMVDRVIANNRTTLNFGHLNPGIYIVNVYSDKGLYVEKLVLR